MPVEMATSCPSCGRESGVSMPGSVSQPLLDALGYQNPVTLAAALRPDETVLVQCRANVGGLAATDRRLLVVKNGQAHEYPYAAIQDINIGKVGWFLSAVFELVISEAPHRAMKNSKEADLADNALSFIRPLLPLFEDAKRRVLQIREARRCRSCGDFVPITAKEWDSVGRPALIEPIPSGGAMVLAAHLQPGERILGQAHAERYYKTVVVTDRRVMLILGRGDSQFHAIDLAALDGAEADDSGLYLWIKGRPRRKLDRPQLVSGDGGIPSNAPDLPKMQQLVAIVNGLVGAGR